jgi:hypothetical protein
VISHAVATLLTNATNAADCPADLTDMTTALPPNCNKNEIVRRYMKEHSVNKYGIAARLNPKAVNHYACPVIGTAYDSYGQTMECKLTEEAWN